MIAATTQTSADISAIFAKIAATKAQYGNNQPNANSTPSFPTSSTTVQISQAALDALAAESTISQTASTTADAKLAEIKAKDPMSRSADDVAYMSKNDPKLAAILVKSNNIPPTPLMADEIDYEQKSLGFVNSFATLSTAEKVLYDKMVSSGNTDAAAGMSSIALTRATLGHTASTSDGATYDPLTTEITAENVIKYFSQSSNDPTGKMQSQFQALIQYLQNNPPTA